MKINIKGDTPMERLKNLTKRVVEVPKADVDARDKEWHRSRKAKRRSRTR